MPTKMKYNAPTNPTGKRAYPQKPQGAALNTVKPAEKKKLTVDKTSIPMTRQPLKTKEQTETRYDRKTNTTGTRGKSASGFSGSAIPGQGRIKWTMPGSGKPAGSEEGTKGNSHGTAYNTGKNDTLTALRKAFRKKGK